MNHKSSFEEAYSLILGDIVDGRLRPGEIITESDLAERYGISRTPVREALNRFQCEGLVSTTNRTKRIYSLSIDDLKEIFEIKKLIEGHLTGKAAENLTDKQAVKLRCIVDEMNKLAEKSPGDEEEGKVLLEMWLNLDRQFHELIYSVAGNRRAEQLIRKLNIQWHRLKVGLIAIEGRINTAIIEHVSIASAVIERDSHKARLAMEEHLESLERIIIKLMEAFGYANNVRN